MISRSFTILFIIHFCCTNIRAQSTYFNKTYDFSLWNPATSVVEINDGYMVLGQVITTEDRKVFLLRTDINGDTIWSKIYGISPMIHFTGVGSSFIQTADNGFAFCGTIADSADSGLDDMLLMKFDSLGDTLWTKRFGGANQDIGQDCEQTTDGGYIIIGTTTSFGDTLGDIYLVKTDSIGNLEWDATYGEGNLDAGLSVSPTADGGYILGGSLSKNGEFIWVIKTDSIGDTLWTTAIDVNLDVGCFVEPSIDGGYIITTDKDNLTGNGKDGYIAKLDGVGAITWEHTYVGSSQNDWLSQVIELPDGSIVAAGQSRNDNNISSGWLLKVTPNGDSLWSRKFSVPDSLSQQFWSLRATLDGGFIMSGFAAAPTQDTWIVKTNCLGYDAPPQANFSSTSDTLTASFINQSQKAGTYLWDFGDGNSSTGSNPSHTYQDSGIYVVTLIAAACGDTSITFNIVQVSIPVGIQEGYAIDDNIQIYPNPTSGRINIIGLSSNEDITITVYNILGELLQKVQLNRLDDYLGDLENYPDGLYILLIEQNNKAYKKRVIKL